MWPLSNRAQLSLELEEAPPKNAEELRSRLMRLGLGAHYRVRLTTNRTVVVSYSGGELRIHNSFLDANEEEWSAATEAFTGAHESSRPAVRSGALALAWRVQRRAIWRSAANDSHSHLAADEEQ